jgi:S1-C subfamily serine protease
MDEKLANYLAAAGKKGVIVKSVEPQSPAEKAGLKESDIIFSIANKKVNSVDDFQSVAKSLAAGDTMQARVWRNGKEKTIAVETKVFPLELAEELAFKLLGIKVDEITTGARRKYRIATREGVVILKIEKNSYLAYIGAEPGDVIRQIDDYTIQNTEDFKKAIVKFRQKNSLVLLIQRGDQGYYITLNLS